MPKIKFCFWMDTRGAMKGSKLSFWLNELTPEMVRKAEVELGETEEVRKTALRELRDMIENEKNFQAPMDDAFLLRFLRPKKFDPKSALGTLRNYCAFKRRYSGVFTEITLSQIRKIFDMNIMAPLPTRLTDGSVAGVVRLGYFDPGSATKEELLATCLVCAELGMESEATQVCGGSLIVDLVNFDWRLLRIFASPSFLYHAVRLMQCPVVLRSGPLLTHDYGQLLDPLRAPMIRTVMLLLSCWFVWCSSEPAKRSFSSLGCMGVYDKAKFARLDRVCEDCYQLYREPDVHTLCRSNCFKNNFFTQCVDALLLQQDQQQLGSIVDELYGK